MVFNINTLTFTGNISNPQKRSNTFLKCYVIKYLEYYLSFFLPMCKLNVFTNLFKNNLRKMILLTENHIVDIIYI